MSDHRGIAKSTRHSMGQNYTGTRHTTGHRGGKDERGKSQPISIRSFLTPSTSSQHTARRTFQNPKKRRLINAKRSKYELNYPFLRHEFACLVSSSVRSDHKPDEYDTINIKRLLKKGLSPCCARVLHCGSNTSSIPYPLSRTPLPKLLGVPDIVTAIYVDIFPLYTTIE